METNNSDAKMKALIENGRKALEKYLISLEQGVYGLSSLDYHLSILSTNEKKIKVLIENGQRAANNYYQERISNLFIKAS
jgi:hypothetical protein